MTKCVFCSIKLPVLENELAVAVYDKFPVSTGHMLLIPRRHVTDFFSTTRAERLALDRLLFEARRLIDVTHHPNGYNIGINVGPSAGQTVKHSHVHLIPRYEGDTRDPRGGVRSVIPSRRRY